MARIVSLRRLSLAKVLLDTPATKERALVATRARHMLTIACL